MVEVFKLYRCRPLGDGRWKELCGGSSRVCAAVVYGDPWMHNPACYLSEEEIGLDKPLSEAMEEDVLLGERAA